VRCERGPTLRFNRSSVTAFLRRAFSFDLGTGVVTQASMNWGTQYLTLFGPSPNYSNTKWPVCISPKTKPFVNDPHRLAETTKRHVRTLSPMNKSGTFILSSISSFLTPSCPFLAPSFPLFFQLLSAVTDCLNQLRICLSCLMSAVKARFNGFHFRLCRLDQLSLWCV